MDEYPSHRSMRGKIAIGLIIALGMLIALTGVAIDFILPGTSPGLNLPQLLIIATGLAISLGALRFRQSRTRQGAAIPFGRTILKAMIITVLTLLALEILLTVWGMPTYFPSEPPQQDVEPAYWRTCDELGCHYVHGAKHPACAEDVITDRLCITNPQGFSDTEEFVAQDDHSDRMRILMMGDSFAFGLSADIGKSFVETLEAALPDAVVWNVAVSGSGTNQDIVAFDLIAPRLNPQLSVLGFFMNDFRDNLMPTDRLIMLHDADGNAYLVERFRYDRWGNPVELPLELVYAYQAEGYNPPISELERIVGLTRLGTLLLRAFDIVTDLSKGQSVQIQQKVTRNYLAQLRDAAYELDSEFLVLIIPKRKDFGDPGDLYQLAVRLMQELAIPYMEVIDLLDPVADYGPDPDIHWNNAGHQKVGALLTECVDVFIASGDLANCERVVVP